MSHSNPGCPGQAGSDCGMRGSSEILEFREGWSSCGVWTFIHAIVIHMDKATITFPFLLSISHSFSLRFFTARSFSYPFHCRFCPLPYPSAIRSTPPKPTPTTSTQIPRNQTDPRTMATNGVNGAAKTYTLPFELSNKDLFQTESYVDAQWVGAKSGKRFEIVDPGSDTAFASCPDNGPEDVDAAMQSSYKAFQTYRKVNPRKRAQWLLEWHRLIVEARDDLAKILTYETGKPLAEAYGELDYSTGFTWWFAGEAERITGTVTVPSAPNRRTFIIKQPVGPAVALVPWNFPVAMILRKAGAALAAGCTMVVKPSPETPLTCLTLAHLASKAGFAPGVFNVLTT